MVSGSARNWIAVNPLQQSRLDSMKRNSTFKSGAVNSRVAAAFALASVGVLLALVAFAATPLSNIPSSTKEKMPTGGGNATAGGPSSTSTSPVWATIASPNFESGYSAIGQQDQNILTSVACASSSECWAVGYSQPTDGFGDRSGAVSTLIEEWNGSSWVIVSSP